MSKDLRQAFKIACSISQTTMKDALIQEVNKILDNYNSYDYTIIWVIIEATTIELR